MKLNQLLNLPEELITKTKLHFAMGIPNREEPLFELYNNTFKEWQEWQSKRNFERDYILSLIYYKPDEWVFGGVFKSLSSKYNETEKCFKYETELTKIGEDLIGRLIVTYKKEFRSAYVYLENYIEDLLIVEYLREKISIMPFQGYEKVNLSFQELKSIINNNIDSWKTALSSVKGVYIITDILNGKHYVGSAYGEESFWQRWSNYVSSFHGYNEGLKKLIDSNGVDYANNFRFGILEIRNAIADKNEIIEREKYWKDLLLTRQFGYNEN